MAARDRVHHMTSRYARTLQDAGYQVTSPAPGSLNVTPLPPGRQPLSAASPEQARQATRAAVAADEAYRTGQFDRAWQLIGQAAELDPGRAGLWDRHRREIAAKQLFTRAQAARTEGDHAQAEQLLAECRGLDPRLEAGWYRYLTGIRNGQLTRQPPRSAAEPLAGDDRNHGQRARQPAQARGTGQEPGPQCPSSPAPSTGPQASGPGRAPTEPEPPPDTRQLSAPPGGRQDQQRVRHSWEPVGEGTKCCARDGCGLLATQRLHPTERRWLTTYTKGGRTVVADRVPACGEDLQRGAGAEQMQRLATEADQQAGLAFRSGDIDRAYRLLTDARALDPARQQLWDIREKQIRAHVAAEQPRQVAHNTEKAPCPQCGNPHVRPIGETYPCLSCESQARLKAAGFTADSPEINRVAEWNRAAVRRADRQQETPQPRPQAEPGHDTGPQITAGAGPVPGEAKDPGREREASE
jgi:tetratricopeptide (TPR) repeat protein